METNQSRERTVTVYRIGARYRTEPWREAGQEAEEVTLLLMPGVSTRAGASGEVLAFSFQQTAGVGVNTAIALGLCRLPEPERDQVRQRRREHRAVDQELTSLRVTRLVAAVASAAVAGDALAESVLGSSAGETLEHLAEHFERAAKRPVR